jgi:hypothetical protein
MRVPDEVLKCVVYIGRRTTSAETGLYEDRYGGTGFIVFIPESSGAGIFTYIVTARHVAAAVRGSEFCVKANLKVGGAVTVVGREDLWCFHPDPAVDVAVHPWGVPDTIDSKGIPASMSLQPHELIEKSIGVGDEVFITGLFNLASGRGRIMPIVRMGNIAMLPDDPIPTGYGETDVYLVEARSIGGISGSPVFVRETAHFPLLREDSGNEIIFHGMGAYYLLGLMHGHWDIREADMNAAILPVAPRGQGVNLGIALVVPAYRIWETLSEPELANVRELRELEIRERQRKESMPSESEGERPNKASEP